jgi:hypothetical protein
MSGEIARALVWNAYVTSPKMPIWKSYVRSLQRFPIVGYTAQDSRARNKFWLVTQTCDCDICKRKQKSFFNHP